VKLSTIYRVVKGDDFNLIARKKYGSEDNASVIASANPGVVEPLTPGTVITVPFIPTDPNNKLSDADSDNSSEVAILIDGVRFRYWTEISITRTIDSIDTLSISAPFDSEDPFFRALFKPFSFKLIVVTIDGTPFFTGTMMNIKPSLKFNSKTFSVDCYALPGVLNDCNPSSGLYSISGVEFNKQSLSSIATALALPLGVGIVVEDDQGAVFERVRCDPSKKILAFLIELAQQRNLIISSTPIGLLSFKSSATFGLPVARLRQGESPLISADVTFDPQSYYSHLTGISPVNIGLEGAQYTVKNDLLSGTIRPFTFQAEDTEDSNVKTATEAKAGFMFGNMVTYTVQVDTWRDVNGDLWAPNTFITLEAPDVLVYNSYTFTIKSIQLQRDENAETAILTLVLPGSYKGEIPDSLPWD
jgi:prophage tail gpP-like protein/phage tail protein X